MHTEAISCTVAFARTQHVKMHSYQKYDAGTAFAGAACAPRQHVQGALL